MKSHKRLILFLALVVIGACVTYLSPIRQHISFEGISEWVDSIGYAGPLVLILVGSFAPILFIPRWTICFLSGFLYGILYGGLIALCASVIGAWIHFHFARVLVSPSSDKLLGKYNLDASRIPHNNAFIAILLSRTLPFTNSSATNILAGALKISDRAYILATIIGMLPSTLMYTAWGKLLKKPSSEFYFIAVGVLIVCLVGMYYSRKYLLPWFKENGSREAA